jgi:hypothetical protein
MKTREIGVLGICTVKELKTLVRKKVWLISNLRFPIAVKRA